MENRVEIVRVKEVSPHPNADRLDVVKAFDYPTIVLKGSFKSGDLGAYVPVDSVVPFTDYWSYVHDGKDDPRHRRVRAKKLRGTYSEGILVPLKDLNLHPTPKEGQDVAKLLKITKYEPPQPKAYTAGSPGIHNIQVPGFPRYTDIENIRRWPDVIEFNEPVVVHEKLHGSNIRFGWAQANFLNDPWYTKVGRWFKRLFDPNSLEFVVGSHGVFRRSRDTYNDWHCDQGDLWWRAAEQYLIAYKLKPYPWVVLFGEVYGDVQDLKYGHGPGEISLAIFDVYHIKERRFYDAFEAAEFIDHLGLPQPPLLYVGTWQSGLIEALRDGNTALPDRFDPCIDDLPLPQIREGFVVKPQMERTDPKLGRVILKAISPHYLERAGGSEGK